MIQIAILAFDSAFLVAMLPMFLWANLCINRTHEERINAIMAAGLRPMTGPQIMHALNAVTFKQHWRARLLRRDPWALYDPVVLDAIKNPRAEFIGGVVMPGGPEEGPPAIH